MNQIRIFSKWQCLTRLMFRRLQQLSTGCLEYLVVWSLFVFRILLNEISQILPLGREVKLELSIGTRHVSKSLYILSARDTFQNWYGPSLLSLICSLLLKDHSFIFISYIQSYKIEYNYQREREREREDYICIVIQESANGANFVRK